MFGCEGLKYTAKNRLEMNMEEKMKEIYAHYLMSDGAHLRFTAQYPNQEADNKLKLLRQNSLLFLFERGDEKYKGKVRKRIYTKIKEI